MIKVLNTSLERLGVIKNAISSNRLEEINGENVLDFEAVLDVKLNNFIGENTIFELDDDYFDTAFFKKIANEDNTYTVEVESEHVSYRLNNPTYNVEYFTETGTPLYILGKILEVTGFTVGTVEYTNVITYSAQEAKSRRQLLIEFVAYLGGEVLFSKFVVSIVTHRGSIEAKPVLKDRNVKIVSKTVNKRTLDEVGNPLISYACTPIYLPGDNYSLGDNIILMQKELGINENLRVVSISRDVYDRMNVTFQFANYINGLESSIYRIATTAVAKDKFYNGTRIGPEFGFETIRNDKKARAYFRSDGFKFQSGDGTGEALNWEDCLYYDYDSAENKTVLVFNGKLSAYTIEAIKAEIAVVVSNTVIVNNLTAEKGYIATLTVDQVDTSDMVTRYLLTPDNPLRTAPVGYWRGYDQYIELLEAQIPDPLNLSEVQVADRQGCLLYWLDEANIGVGITLDTTLYPVKRFIYNGDDGTGIVKLSIHHRLNDLTGYYEPIIIWGVGNGNPLDPDRGKAFMYKDADGFVIEYLNNDGKASVVSISDFVDANHRRISTCEIDRVHGKLTVLQEGEAVGDETDITFVEGVNTITYTWPDTFTTVISIL